MQTRENKISLKVLDWLANHPCFNAFPDKAQEKIKQWHSGETIPTVKQIEKVSTATNIPLGYFFLKTPPEEDLSFVKYRTIDSIEHRNMSQNLIDTLHNMKQMQEWQRNFVISQDISPLTFVGTLKNISTPQVFADKMRNILDIKPDWYKKSRSADDSFRIIRKAVSDAGVAVMMSGIVENNTHRPLSLKEFRAFSLVDDYAPLIFINAKDSANGRLFSLLHEFAHICKGENSLFNDYEHKEETLCNAAAAEVLVPKTNFIEDWEMAYPKNSEAEAISMVASKFKCSLNVIARRAFDCGFINRQAYENTVQSAIKQYDNKKNKQSGGDFYNNLASRIDKRFLDMLVSSVEEGKTLYSDAFRLTNTNRSTFNKLIASAPVK